MTSFDFINNIILWCLLIFIGLTCTSIVGIAVYVILTQVKYIKKWKKNLSYIDIVISNLIESSIKAGENFNQYKDQYNILNAHIYTLKKNIDSLVNDSAYMDYEKILTEKYADNQKFYNNLTKDRNIKVVGEEKQSIEDIQKKLYKNLEQEIVREKEVIEHMFNKCPNCSSILHVDNLGRIRCQICGYETFIENTIDLPFIEPIKNPYMEQSNTIIYDYEEQELLKNQENDINLLHPKISKEITIDRDIYTQPLSELFKKV